VDALFFMAHPDAAAGVSSSHDLPTDPIAEPLRVETPSPVVALAEALGPGGRAGPLRDATCRSFPAWRFDAEIRRRVAALDDEAIDAIAERWMKLAGPDLDADLFELATCLGDLRDAVRSADPAERLFVLLAERAF